MGKVLRALQGLFFSRVGGASLGRLAFWPVFALAVYNWGNGRDIQEHHFYTLVICFVYLTTGKIRDVLEVKGLKFDKAPAPSAVPAAASAPAPAPAPLEDEA
jgi:hypothetical protein